MRSALIALTGASLFCGQAAAQPAIPPGLDLTCEDMKLNGNRGMTLTRLCVEALYSRADGLGLTPLVPRP